MNNNLNKNQYQKIVLNITNRFGSNLVLGGDFNSRFTP